MPHTLEITRGHPIFDRLIWVCRAVPPKGWPQAELLRLKVEPDCVSATDGHRAHISRGACTLIPGLYYLDKLTKTKVSLRLDEAPRSYPDVIPRLWPSGRRTYGVLDIDCNEIPSALARIIRALPLQYSVDTNYLTDMLEGQDFIGVSLPDGPYALTFANADCTRTGALMPICV